MKTLTDEQATTIREALIMSSDACYDSIVREEVKEAIAILDAAQSEAVIKQSLITDEARRVRCNHCMSEFDEKHICSRKDSPEEYCPVCGKIGALMDMEEQQDPAEAREEGRREAVSLIELCDMYFLGCWRQEYAGAPHRCVYCGTTMMKNGKGAHHSASCPVTEYEPLRASIMGDSEGVKP